MRARKRFGQNFLHDAGYLRRMRDAIRAKPDDTVLEIGPGHGELTEPLLETAGAVRVIEIDRDLARSLQARLGAHPHFELLEADALEVDLEEWPSADGPLRVVGNLPYNISTPLLFHLLRYASRIRDLHLLLQREVVQRMAAPPGSRERGRLSVMVQFHARVERLFDVPRGAFVPAPQVTSSFVRLVPHAAPVVDVPDPDAFGRLVAAGFSARRKTLRNTLKGWVTSDGFEDADVDSARRAETLSLAEWAALARVSGTKTE